MLQNWALGSYGGQTINPFTLQQIEYIRLQQQLQQIQQLVQSAAYQLQVLAQHQQTPQVPLGAQAFGQPSFYQPSIFQPSPHVM